MAEKEVLYTRNLPLGQRMELYEKALHLHNHGYGSRRISKLLNMPIGTAISWLYKKRKPTTKTNNTEIDVSKIKQISYLAGVVGSDGWLNEHGYKVGLGCTDEDFTLEFKKAVKSITGKSVYVYQRAGNGSHIHNEHLFRQTKPYVIAAISCKELYEVLSNPGEYIKKSPESYIRGFADGDGTIYRDRVDGYYHIKLYNKDLPKLQKIKQLLAKLGITSRISVHNKEVGLCAVVINNQLAVKKFMEKVGFSIRRKQEKWKGEKPTLASARARARKYYYENRQQILFRQRMKRIKNKYIEGELDG